MRERDQKSGAPGRCPGGNTDRAPAHRLRAERCAGELFGEMPMNPVPFDCNLADSSRH